MKTFKILKGNDGYYHAVFPSNIEADELQWYFYGKLGCARTCFGQYENAYRLV